MNQKPVDKINLSLNESMKYRKIFVEILVKAPISIAKKALSPLTT